MKKLIPKHLQGKTLLQKAIEDNRQALFAEVQQKMREDMLNRINTSINTPRVYHPSMSAYPFLETAKQYNARFPKSKYPQTTVGIRNDVLLTGVPRYGTNSGGYPIIMSEGVDANGKKGILTTYPTRHGIIDYGELWDPEGSILYNTILEKYNNLKRK